MPRTTRQEQSAEIEAMKATDARLPAILEEWAENEALTDEETEELKELIGETTDLGEYIDNQLSGVEAEGVWFLLYFEDLIRKEMRKARLAARKAA